MLLTQYPLDDPFLAQYIEDLRDRTNNELITAEQVDLSSLYSIRKFATKWTDNLPPRRLDALILLASTQPPKGSEITVGEEGVENTFQVNYLANFQLLSILSPALRAQPPDRDVRVVLGTCSSYLGGELPETVPVPKLPSVRASGGSRKAKKQDTPKAANPTKAYGSAKLALMTFSHAFQKHLASYKRKDGADPVARVICVDPGWSRTPGTRRSLSMGTLWGLFLYLVTWPMWWLVLKSPEQGSQSLLWATMEEKFAKGQGWHAVKECLEVSLGVKEADIKNEEKQKQLWEMSDKAVEALEKQAAQKRATKKSEDEERRKKEEREKQREQENERKPGSRKSKKGEKA